jgi:hypothetical protein
MGVAPFPTNPPKLPKRFQGAHRFSPCPLPVEFSTRRLAFYSVDFRMGPITADRKQSLISATDKYNVRTLHCHNRVSPQQRLGKRLAESTSGK